MANDDIQTLIDSLRRGQYEDPTEKIGLLSAALQEKEANMALLLSLLRAPQIPLRLAALDAIRKRTEPELLSEALSFATHNESRIRIKLAEILVKRTGKETAEALNILLRDAESEVREAALKSTVGRPEFRSSQEAALKNDSVWQVRLAAVHVLETQKTPQILMALGKALEQDDDEDVRRRCAEIIEERLDASPQASERNLPKEIAGLSKAEGNLKLLGADRFPKLMSWITAQTTITVDPEALAKFGTDLTALALNQSLPHAYCAAEECATVLKLIQREPSRSIALLGNAGVGKSALVNELTYELAKPENGSWRVLRISPTDFMAGTRYIGEWETKVRELIDAIRKPRRVLLYVPNLADLAAAGSWSRSESSVATALAAYLEDGSILMLGESAPQEFERGLGRIPSLQRLFDRVLMLETSPERTRDILAGIRDEQQSAISDESLDQLLEVSNQFLSHISRPGNAVALLRTVIKREKESGKAVTFRDVLECLSNSTGVPVDLLDDATPLKRSEVREFFEKKIMGQPEAVDAMIDMVTLIKAGVTDPNKPFGIFLFVGPTGVGKTELARSLAEFIFGDAARLKRFDMSEFAGIDGFTRLIGGANENGLLTDAVRQHPFSVVLLDEIEKSHINVFDLCLQIFDAGRLTDGRGRTIDFRRTIVILTSNIGSTTATAPLGFVTNDSAPAVDVDKDRTFRELSRFFRPEFLNRLDRIIQFRALSMEVAEQIARREIDLVLQRSGIRRRQLAIDIEPAVIALLVREGYSPHFGARPLKRTVERLLLLPLARAISSGAVKGRTILRLTANVNHVDAAVTTLPETKTRPATDPNRNAVSLIEEWQVMFNEFAELEQQVRPLADRKSELLSRTREPDFFRDANTRSVVLDEIHKLEQFLVLHENLGKRLDGLGERLKRYPISMNEEPALRERLDQIQGELAHVCFVAQCKDARDLGDALITVSLVDRTGKPQTSVQKLIEMYSSLALRKRLTTEVLGELYDEKRDVVHLLIAGLGSYALLKHETGLHQMDRRFKERTPRAGREVIREDREVVRVVVNSVSGEPIERLKQEVNIKITALKPVRKRLISKADIALALFHKTTLRSVEFWTNGPREAALQRAFLVLQAATESNNSLVADDSIVRHYDVGLAPKIKDTRTGRSSTRVEQIFKGDFRAFTSKEE